MLHAYVVIISCTGGCLIASLHSKAVVLCDGMGGMHKKLNETICVHTGTCVQIAYYPMKKLYYMYLSCYGGPIGRSMRR